MHSLSNLNIRTDLTSIRIHDLPLEEVADSLSFGNPILLLSFDGPYLGLLASKNKKPGIKFLCHQTSN